MSATRGFLNAHVVTQLVSASGCRKITGILLGGQNDEFHGQFGKLERSDSVTICRWNSTSSGGQESRADDPISEQHAQIAVFLSFRSLEGYLSCRREKRRHRSPSHKVPPQNIPPPPSFSMMR